MIFSCERRFGPVAKFSISEGGTEEFPDTWRSDNTCSYCGSMNPDYLMERLEAGTVEVGPTDKNYKLYVTNAGGELFKQTYKDDGTWVTNSVDHSKFYFQHFSMEQRTRFVELLNKQTVKIGYPGYFYVMPFFIGPA